MLNMWLGSRAQPDGTIWQTRIHLDSARTAVSSVTVNPLQHERTVTGSGSIDIPSTVWCGAMISMLVIWQEGRTQLAGTICPTLIYL